MKTSDALKFTAEIINTLEEAGLTESDMLVVLGAVSKIITDRQVEQLKKGFQQTLHNKFVEALENRKERRVGLKAVKNIGEKLN